MTLTENSPVLYKLHQGASGRFTQPEITVVTYLHAQTTLAFLPADGEAS